MMLLKQKRQSTDLERDEYGDYTQPADPLFESDWEVLVIRRDEQTGEFRIRTLSLDEATTA